LAKGTCFELAGEAAAGHYSAASIGNDQAMRIFTGAYLPDGADSVAIQEDVNREGDQICLNENVKPGQFVRTKGLDFSAGEVILQASTILGARQLALAGLAGYSALPVRQKPVVAIISSGDELVPVGDRPQAGQLINSNSVFLAHALRLAGAKVADLGIIPDKKGALISALQAGLATYKQFDLIVSTGGRR
jgi:molybdopterin molybdotransferase